MAGTGFDLLQELQELHGWAVAVTAGLEPGSVAVEAWKWLGHRPIREEGPSVAVVAPAVVERARVVDLLLGVEHFHA